MSLEEKSPGWFTPDYVLQHPGLTPAEKLIMGTVFNLSQLSDGCTASLKYIADQLGMTRESVKRHIVRLRKDGFLEANPFKFPEKAKGARLKPVRSKFEGVVKWDRHGCKINPLGVQKLPVGVQKCTQIQSYTNNTKEREDGSFLLQNRFSIIQSAIERLSVTEDQASRKFDQLVQDLRLSGKDPEKEILSWPAYLCSQLKADLRKSAAPPPPPEPVSQFSRCH